MDGKIFDDLLIKKKIGTGVSSVVYRGIFHGEHCAVKMFSLNSDSEVPSEYINETFILSRLKHKYVINIHATYIKNNILMTLMPLFDYSLHNIIYSKKTIQLPSILRKICLGLKYIHDQGFLHRDLKPSNILLSKGNKLNIIDFGLSEIRGRTYHDEAVTIWYRSPELLKGTTKYDTEIDVWSLGCIFAEMVLRKPFFPTKDLSISSSLEIIHEKLVTEKEYLSLYFTDNQCLDLLLKMLNVNPIERISLKDILAHEFLQQKP